MAKKKKRKKKGRVLENIILAVAVIVLAVSVWQLATIFLEYKAGTDTYKRLQGFAVEKVKPQQETEGQEQAREEIADFPELEIDYEELEKINGEFIGWLYLPVLEISYPMVQGADNEYYLTHTFEKTQNKSGAIFMDSSADVDMTDFNTFVYGHNMRNLSMFGKLKEFIRDEKLCDENPFLYIYTEDTIYKYQIVSYYVTLDGSSTYFLPGTQEDYDRYRSMILQNTPYKSAWEQPQEGPILTLSTCYGSTGSDERFVVHGILVDTKNVN